MGHKGPRNFDRVKTAGGQKGKILKKGSLIDVLKRKKNKDRGGTFVRRFTIVSLSKDGKKGKSQRNGLGTFPRRRTFRTQDLVSFFPATDQVLKEEQKGIGKGSTPPGREVLEREGETSPRHEATTSNPTGCMKIPRTKGFALHLFEGSWRKEGDGYGKPWKNADANLGPAAQTTGENSEDRTGEKVKSGRCTVCGQGKEKEHRRTTPWEKNSTCGRGKEGGKTLTHYQ